MGRSIFPLPEVSDPTNMRTLGEYIALGAEIRARCTSTGCNHNVALNLIVVAHFLGRDHGAFADDLKPYFYCPDCRSAGLADDNISFFYHPCTAPHTMLCEVIHEEFVHRTAA